MTVIFYWGLYVTLLCATSVWDLRHRRIPNGLCAALFVLGMPGSSGVWFSVGGIVTASLPFLAAALLRPGSIGGGDWKLMAAAGVLLGAQGTLMALGIGFLLAGCSGVIRHALGRNGRFPIGPYLCVGIIGAVLWG